MEELQLAKQQLLQYQETTVAQVATMEQVADPDKRETLRQNVLKIG
jgi:hypothetical protein